MENRKLVHGLRRGLAIRSAQAYHKLSSKGGGIRALAEIFKLRQTALLVLTGVLGYLIASGGAVEVSLFTLIVALLLAVSGTTGLNMYFDRDIDRIMFRTRRRPLPAGRVSSPLVLGLSLALAIAGVLLALRINPLCGLAVFLGFFIDFILYTLLLKQSSVLNVTVGGLAGGMPAAAGYAAYAGRLDWLAISLILIVSLWATAHIWLIASYYIEDYRAVPLPMLPVVYGERRAVIASLASVLLIEGLLLSLYLLNYTNFIPSVIALVGSLPLWGLSVGYLRSGRRELLRKGFKALSPYIILVFLSIFFFKG